MFANANRPIRNYGLHGGDTRSSVNPRAHPTTGGDYGSHVVDGFNRPSISYTPSMLQSPGADFQTHHNTFRTQGTNNDLLDSRFTLGPNTTVVDILSSARVRIADGLIGKVFRVIQMPGNQTFHNIQIRQRTFHVTPAVEQPDLGTATTFDDSENVRSFSTTRVAKAKQIGTYWSLESASAEWMVEFANQMLSAFELTMVSMCYQALQDVYTPEKCVAQHGVTINGEHPVVSGADYARTRVEEASLLGLLNKDPMNAATRMLTFATRAMQNSAHMPTLFMIGERPAQAGRHLTLPPVSEVGERRVELMRGSASVIDDDLQRKGISQMIVPRNYIGADRRAYDPFAKMVAFGKFATTPDWPTVERLGATYTAGRADPQIIDYDTNSFTTLRQDEAFEKSGLTYALSNPNTVPPPLLQLYLDSVFPYRANGRNTVYANERFRNQGTHDQAVQVLTDLLRETVANITQAAQQQGARVARIRDWYDQPDIPAHLLGRANAAGVATRALMEWPVECLFSDHVYNIFKNNGIPYPVPFLCGRFGITVETENVLAIDATEPVGVVVGSGVDQFQSKSINQYETIMCISHMGAGIATPEAIAPIPNAFLREYRGGGNTVMFENTDVNAVGAVPAGRHTVVVPLTFKQLRSAQSNRVFTFAVPGFALGDDMSEIHTIVADGAVDRPGYMPSGPMCEYFIKRFFPTARYYLGVENIQGGLGGRAYIDNVACTQAYQMAPAVGGIALSTMERMTPCTHFGHCPHPDVISRLVRLDSIAATC